MDTFTHRKSIFRILLKQHPHILVPFVKIDLLEVYSVKQNFSIGWIVESAQQLNERCLTRSVEPDQGNLLAWIDRQG